MNKHSYIETSAERRKRAVRCGHVVAHGVAVERTRRDMPDAGTSEDLAELFKAFGDPTRVRMLSALNAGEMCVCALAEALGMTQSAVSHQLRLLKQMRLIRARKEGRSVFYALNDDHVHLIFALALEHVAEPR
jgi:ArsR family transcriptional regulator